MIQLWVVICLILSAFTISALGAAFSILGIKALFTGAWLAVSMMAGALELAKFTIAAFLHQTWTRINMLMKIYLFVSVILLSAITSLGIFGYLSDAYQASSTTLESETIKIASLRNQKIRFEDEMERLTAQVEEIPDSRITKKIKMRQELEPKIQDLKKKQDDIIAKITQSDLLILDVKRKVGPLIYIAKAFNIDIDTAVKYLILAFVLVFDPLAICLVIAVSFALEENKKHRLQAKHSPQTQANTQSIFAGMFDKSATANQTVNANSEPATGPMNVELNRPAENVQIQFPPSPPPPDSENQSAAGSQESSVVKMRFADIGKKGTG
jgi:hypothetical protein